MKRLIFFLALLPMFAHAQVNYDSLYRTLYIQYNPAPFGFTKLILPIDTAKLPTYTRNNIKGSLCFFNNSLYVNNGTGWAAVGSSNYYAGFGMGLHNDTFYVDTTKIATKYQLHDSLAGYATTVALTDTAAAIRSAIPSGGTASLTATYIGVGNGSNQLSGTNDLNYNTTYGFYVQPNNFHAMNVAAPDASHILFQAGDYTGYTNNTHITVNDAIQEVDIVGTNVAIDGNILNATWGGYAIGLNVGGTNSDLSATGGAGNYLKQSSPGAAITVGTIPLTDITGTAVLATTVALTDTAIARAATAQTNLIDTAAAIRSSIPVVPSIYVNSVVGTAPVTASVSTHTVTVGINTITATSVLANTTTANATPAQSISYSSLFGTTSNLVSRDANGNSHANNFESQRGSVNSSPQTLTSGNPRITEATLAITSTPIRFNLNPGTTFNAGHVFEIDNNSNYVDTVFNYTGSQVSYNVPGSYEILTLTNTVSNAWDNHWLLPSTYIAGTSIFNISGATLTAANFSGTSSGTNTGDQTITLTGDVTGSGTGSFTTTLKNTGTAGTYGGSAGQLLGITTDAQGRVSGTSIYTFTPTSGTVTSVGLVAGTGMSVTGTSPITGSGTYTVVNTSPDKTVTITGATGLNVTSAYPAFTLTPTGVNSVVATGVMTATGTTTVTVGMPQSNTSTSGYLSSTDWNTFNGKGSGSVTSIQVASNAAAYSVTPTSAVTSSGIYSIVPTGTSGQYVKGDGTLGTSVSGTVTSVKVVSNLTCYTVTPTTSVTSSGIYSLVATGTSSQFAKGDGSLDNNTYLTGNQTITLTGAVTGSGATSIATTLAASIVGTANLSATGTPSATTYLSGTNVWSTPTAGPGGSNTQVQYNNSGSLGGASNLLIAADGNALHATSVYTTAVTAPSSGNIKVYGNSINGQDELWTSNSAGVDIQVETFLGQHQWGLWTTNGTSTQQQGFFTAATSTSGTSTFNLRTYDATNLAPNLMYNKLTGSASPNNQVEIWFGYTGRDAMIGNNTYGGGSKLVIDCALPSYVSTQRFFAGYTSTFGQISTTTDPSAVLNIIGVGKDAADATLQFMFNNGSGTATKVNTGITPTVNDEYIITVTLPSNTASSTVTIERRTKSTSTKNSATNSAKIPSAGTLMYWHAMSNSAAASTAPVIGIKQVWEELY
jgi:hypothetical protein